MADFSALCFKDAMGAFMVKIRKIVIVREQITSDAFGEPCEALSRVAAAAVFQNPLAGRFEPDLTPLFEIGAEAGATTLRTSRLAAQRFACILWQSSDCRDFR